MKIGKLEKVWVNSKWQSQKNIKIAEPLFDQVNIDNVQRVLEVGCGNGVLSSYLAEKHGWNVTGIDIDPDQKKIAKKIHKEHDSLTCVEADATELPYENNEFDLTLSFDVLHHIPNWDMAIKEINRVLRPEGLYIMNDLASRYFHQAIRSLLGRYMSVFTVDELIDDLKHNKFDILYEKKLNAVFLYNVSIVCKKNI